MGKRAAGPSNSQATSKKKAAADSSAVDGFREAAKTLRDAHQTKIRADLETELEKVPHLWAELLEMLRNKTLEHRANSEEEDDDDLPQSVNKFSLLSRAHMVDILSDCLPKWAPTVRGWNKKQVMFSCA